MHQYSLAQRLGFYKTFLNDPNLEVDDIVIDRFKDIYSFDDFYTTLISGIDYFHNTTLSFYDGHISNEANDL